MKLSTVLYIKSLIDEDVNIAKEIMDLDYSKYEKSVSHKCSSSEVESNKKAFLASQRKYDEILDHKRSFENGIILS